MAQRLRSAAVLIFVLVLQLELFSELRLFGVMPELLLGLTIVVAWSAGASSGATFGFVAGVLYDLYLPTPFGLSALTYALMGWGVGAAAEAVADGVEKWARRVLWIVAVAVGVSLFVTIGELLGQDKLFADRFWKILFVTSFYTAALMPPMYLLGRWLVNAEGGSRRPPSFSVVRG